MYHYYITYQWQNEERKETGQAGGGFELSYKLDTRENMQKLIEWLIKEYKHKSVIILNIIPLKG